ncbi:hypothetical protein GCM10007162_14040 [Ignatzschineria ureiclastica]|nr:hypothetical protein GCM10007162_14040 [Ignatzschineria ureiclastica]
MLDFPALLSAFKAYYPQALLFSDQLQLSDEQTKITIEPLRATRHYLGATTEAVLLDVRQGFPLDYFLAITATIRQGGLLILLLNREDKNRDKGINGTFGTIESLRFHSEAIATPFFDRYLQQQLSYYGYRFVDHRVMIPDYLQNPHLNLLNQTEKELDSGEVIEITPEQQVIIHDFQAQSAGIYTLFAPRGCGKSWLSSQLVAHNVSDYIVTAPNQSAISQYQHIDGLQFRAPDALFLAQKPDQYAETLIVEEAGKMPLNHLVRLCQRFQKILLISSTDNYEGTGQGLQQKLPDLITIHKNYQLSQIHRFDPQDPLQQLSNALMLQNGERSTASLTYSKGNEEKDYILPKLIFRYFDDHNIAELRSNIPAMRALYQLLNRTHYQTHIQDLRRLFDLPGQCFLLAYLPQAENGEDMAENHRLIGAIWGVEEGGLSEDLIAGVFNGYRRPKGNLVAQMLTGQSYFPEAMRQHSIRISRISVDESYRRLGIGQAMVKQLEEAIKGRQRPIDRPMDFISVSFGLTQNLRDFWRSCHYQMIHLGYHLDKSTGLYSAVVIKALNAVSKAWIAESIGKFQADAFLHLQNRTFLPEIKNILEEYAKNGKFDQRDQMVIEACEQEKRAIYSVQNALIRRDVEKSNENID